MKIQLFLICAIVSACLFVGFTAGQDKQIQRANPQAQNKGQGQIVTQPLAQVRKFTTPIVNPPGNPPPTTRPGHRWHWHQHHGWIMFPVASAPQTIVIPQNYQLPQQLMIYQQQIGCSFTCPHCSQTITLSVQ